MSAAPPLLEAVVLVLTNGKPARALEYESPQTVKSWSPDRSLDSELLALGAVEVFRVRGIAHADDGHGLIVIRGDDDQRVFGGCAWQPRRGPRRSALSNSMVSQIVPAAWLGWDCLSIDAPSTIRMNGGCAEADAEDFNRLLSHQVEHRLVCETAQARGGLGGGALQASACRRPRPCSRRSRWRFRCLPARDGEPLKRPMRGLAEAHAAQFSWRW